MSVASIQIFVKGIEGKSTGYWVSPDETCADLMRKIQLDTSVPVKEQRLIFSGKQLEAEKKLSEYGIIKESNIYMVARLRGGSSSSDDIEYTDAPDMITWDDTPENPRAKMPCGHALTAESLITYCRSIMDSGKHAFICPYIDRVTKIFCRIEWQYTDVRRIGCLSNDQKEHFERKLSENYLLRACGVQQCPKCSTYCERIDKKTSRLICPICTKKATGTKFEFCWFCLHAWKDWKSQQKCGNDGCKGVDMRLSVLLNAPKKTVGSVADVPSMRACIKCGLLIEHESACKHMTCRCGYQFCFICLKSKVADKWTCGAYNAKCDVAPVQSSIGEN